MHNISFYTGFPNFDTSMAIFNFNDGENGNTRYCSNKQDVPAEFYICGKEDVGNNDEYDNYLQ